MIRIIRVGPAPEAGFLRVAVQRPGEVPGSTVVFGVDVEATLLERETFRRRIIAEIARVWRPA